MQPDPWGGNEPEHKAPEQNHFVDPQVATNPTMQQPDSFWSDGTQVISGSVGNPQMGGVMYLQPPSAAPKVMGILLIIYAVFNLFGILTIFVPAQPDPISGEIIEMSSALVAVNAFNVLITSAGFGLGGYWMLNYQRKGMHLALLTVLIATILAVVAIPLGAAEGANSTFALFGVGEGGTSAIFAGITLFCQGICALIVAIPLMISNNGFDDSKLTDIFG